jgi:ribosome biogenesis GTPase
VQFRPVGEEGFVERVEPRRSELSRTSKGRRQVIAANIDRVLIIASVAEPRLKPNLIDRYLVMAEKDGLDPVIVFSKVDLVDPAELQPIAGVYSQLGYRVLFLSVKQEQGVAALRKIVSRGASVVSGQSGVGKTSLLNALEPRWNLAVSEVSQENDKGRHTTTTATLLPLSGGGHIVDTPGIRQFRLWDVIPSEVAGAFREFRPYVSTCRYPNCMHMQEDLCAVKDAVADGLIDPRRYESYFGIASGDDA